MEQSAPTSITSPSIKSPKSRSGDLVQLRGSDYVPASFERRWIPTRNERNFNIMMDVLAKGEGRGRFGMIVGPFGRGKTWMVRRYAANHRSIYLLCWDSYKTSELGLLQALCRELGLASPPGRKDACLLQIVDRLVAKPRVVFLDEMDLVPKRLDIIRQIVEVTASTFVLVGETDLADHMARNGRTWSRTFQTLVMDPVSLADVIYYAREAAGLEVSEEAAAILHPSQGGGDWRNLERLVIELVEICNSNKTRVVTEASAKLAVKLGLKGVSL